jgi:LysM repeat protein
MKGIEAAPQAAKVRGTAVASTKNSEGPEEAGLQYYVIGKGETLSEIATQLSVSIGALKELNGISNPKSIRAGQKIIIPAEKK